MKIIVLFEECNFEYYDRYGYMCLNTFVLIHLFSCNKNTMLLFVLIRLLTIY